MSKNCKDCIKNNRRPNAVGCLECAVVKSKSSKHINEEQAMRLEYKYGQVFLADLHPGDMIPAGCGDYRILTEKDIDENGYLNIKQEVSNTLSTNTEENE